MLLWIEVRADGKDFEGKDIEGGEFEALKPTEIRLFCGTPCKLRFPNLREKLTAVY
jgi:hypothetical protein